MLPAEPTTSTILMSEVRRRGLSTLRLKYNLMKIHQDSPPTISVSILDNCVGQNKSQRMMKFYCLLSVCFYNEVAALFLISGHSHMLPDRAAAHAKRALKLKNVWHPKQLVKLVNEVKNLHAEFLDHGAPRPPFFIGWDSLLDKYFVDLPGGYTDKFFFEFKKGQVYVRQLCDTPDAEAWSHNMLIGDSLEATRKAILRDLFGSKKKEKCTFDNVRLARHPGVQLTEKKIASIAKKYPTIPDEFISYYPKEVALADNTDSQAGGDCSDDETIANISKKLEKKRKQTCAAPADKKKHKLLAGTNKKVGRPKKARPVPPGTVSILKFVTFKPTNEVHK